MSLIVALTHKPSLLNSICGLTEALEAYEVNDFLQFRAFYQTSSRNLPVSQFRLIVHLFDGAVPCGSTSMQPIQ